MVHFAFGGARMNWQKTRTGWNKLAESFVCNWQQLSAQEDERHWLGGDAWVTLSDSRKSND
jgi:hypothetical protein